MEPKFILSKSGRNYLNILGLLSYYDPDTKSEKSIYTSEEPEDINEFMYTETISINGLFTVTSSGVETLTELKQDSITTLTYMISEHKIGSSGNNLDDISIAEFPNDGLYKIRHIVLPTWDWVSELNQSQEGINLLALYKADEDNNGNHLYVYNDSTIYLVNLEDCENPELSTEYDISAILSGNMDAYSGTLYYEDQYTFTTFELQECFYKINKALLNSLCSDPCNTNNNSTQIYNRDLVWMGINVIKYLLDLGQFYEAQLTLENLEGCAGICSKSNSTKNGGSDCGCNIGN